MADAETEQEPRAVGLALGLDRREEVVDRLLLPTLAAEQLVPVSAQAEDVRRGISQPSSMNSAIGLLAQSLDVERAAGDEVPQPLEALGGADQPAGAAHVDLAFLGHGLGVHIGQLREFVGGPRLVAGEVLDHLGDDIAGT